jgi:hypothetical protein
VYGDKGESLQVIKVGAWLESRCKANRTFDRPARTIHSFLRRRCPDATNGNTRRSAYPIGPIYPSCSFYVYKKTYGKSEALSDVGRALASPSHRWREIPLSITQQP